MTKLMQLLPRKCRVWWFRKFGLLGFKSYIKNKMSPYMTTQVWMPCTKWQYDRATAHRKAYNERLALDQAEKRRILFVDTPNPAYVPPWLRRDWEMDEDAELSMGNRMAISLGRTVMDCEKEYK